MRIVVVSDTHGKHREIGPLHGDVLIHCGDLSNGIGYDIDELDDSDRNLIDLDNWFGEQKFHRILCIGGNHDFLVQERSDRGMAIFQNAIYLQDASYEYEGVSFYGSPWIPELFGWAFYLDSVDLRAKWSMIPEQTDVLITHSPPKGILDRNTHGKSCGCSDLRDRVEEVRPRLHCFGHVHGSAGMTELNGVTFLNAAMVNRKYEIAREPLKLDL
jgi:Icc-related predicted phosphoesterase